MLFTRSSLAVDAYVLDFLLCDLVEHDKHPSAFLVYLHLYGQAERTRWQPVTASLRQIAAATGLSKSAVQSALQNLRRRELVESEQAHPTSSPQHHVRRPWRARWRKPRATVSRTRARR